MMEGESLLLGVIVALASQFGRRHSTSHEGLAPWIDHQITALLQGDLEMRTVASVEALLLWAEWPAITISDRTSSIVGHAADKQLDDDLSQIKQADARSWTYIGKCYWSGRSLSHVIPLRRPRRPTGSGIGSPSKVFQIRENRKSRTQLATRA